MRCIVLYGAKTVHKKRPHESVWHEKLGRHWIPLENASKIFVATYNSSDTKVYRYTVELYEEVDPVRLQQATDRALDAFDLYRATIRRGLFWYYLEETDLPLIVRKETDVPCAPLYTHDYRGLLFRVLYRDCRIHLEVFHALSDGNGSLRFFRAILAGYFGEETPDTVPALAPFAHEDHMADAFSGSLAKEERVRLRQMIGQRVPAVFGKRNKEPAAYRILGTPTPDGRMRVTEMRCDTKTLLALAKSYGATVTVFLTALFMQSIRADMPARQKKRNLPISVALSVDLRTFYPSETARNFFATVRVSRNTDDTEDLQSICDALTAQFKEKITKEKMDQKLHQLLALEESPALRWIPRPVKDLILKIANRANNRNITAAMTNTGRLGIDAGDDANVRSAGVLTAAARPQFSVMSHGDLFTITFTSPFQGDGIQRHFHALLTAEGIPVKVYGNRVYGSYQKSTLPYDASRYPDVPLRYNAKTALIWLTSISIFLGILAVTLRTARPHWQLSFRFSLFLIAGLWIVVLAILRKRRNPNKALLYQTGIFSALTIAWDFLSGWSGWSLNYAVPLIAMTTTAAGMIAARVSRLRRGDTLLYTQGVALLGMVPFAVALFGWAEPVWPSLVAASCNAIVLLVTLISNWDELKAQVEKRFHM